jgi:hypothetical protein
MFAIDLPPGFYRNGTELESIGRWRDGNLVRWRDGAMQPVGGWERRVNANNDALAAITTAAPRGAISWQDNSGTRWIAVGSYNQLKVVTSGGTITNITPGSLTAGREDAEYNTGFGGGFFGLGLFGTARPETGEVQPATTWSMDTWGEYLVACSSDDGTLWEWQLNTASNAAAITNAPTDCVGLLVTPERFLFALGAGGEPLKVQWSDKEDNTTWTAAATNEAGSFTLQSGAAIMAGVNVRGQSLILTEVDAYTATYIGPPFVYGFERVGSNCGAISRRAAAAAAGGALWMGNRAFFAYEGGAVREIKSDVSDYVFNNINQDQKSKIYAVANSAFGEVWWFYPSTGSTECDSYVALNYEEGFSLIGAIDRTCGVDAGAIKHPIWFDSSGRIYNHETGTTHTGATAYAETGPIITGSTTTHVLEMWPDEKTQGDVTATFKTRQYPNGSESSHGPYTMSAPTSVRFSGRQIRLRVTENNDTSWRVGVPRLDIRQGGGR